MSDDSEDPPLEFPNSDTEENCGHSTFDAEPVTNHSWAPEVLQLMVDHGMDPSSFENDEDNKDSEEEDKPGEFLT